MQHYATEAAKVVQDVFKSCRTLFNFLNFILAQSGKILCTVLVQEFCFTLFWHKVPNVLHNSCARVLFYFILLQMGEPDSA